jgi:hypothetical protein
MPDDFSFAKPGYKLSPRQSVPGEPLFQFDRAADQKRFRCELRDHGIWGVEAQFFDPVDLVIAQTFQDVYDGQNIVPARSLATAWAAGMRKTIKAYEASDE